ncbi:unnamed protein product [Leptidea sinapis]|uniref:Uncharacterized protein n=1 Tax=Leptidea sinapis TaxID=189913 RepID=A0A5E4QRY7_9NEOP|nr:unnamed protein product [Leptidea sinapis]
MYGRKTPSTYRSTPSVYSHYTGKSSTNLRSSKSIKSLRVPWYQKPILHDAFVLDLQRGSLLTGFISVSNRVHLRFDCQRHDIRVQHPHEPGVDRVHCGGSLRVAVGLQPMGTMASLNASLAGSRPTTPHSTVSTMPASQI